MRLTSRKLKHLIVEVINEARMKSTAENLQNFFDSLQREDGPSTMAVITAQNPPAKVASHTNKKFADRFDKVIPQINDSTIKWNNHYKMRDLESDLNSLNLDYMQVRGEYFGPEMSFLVFDISKEQAIELGKKYLQDAIVFGQKMRASNMADFEQGYVDPDFQARDPESLMSQPSQGPKIYFDFDLINLESSHFSGKNYSDRPSPITDYHVEDSKNMIIAGANTQARTNLFTKAGGKKFVIPFYSEDPQHDAMTNPDLYNVRPVTR